MTIEDRVRTATRERADLVREISPLDLPASPQRRRLLRGFAPVTAVAVVAALAIALVSVRYVQHGAVAGHSEPAAAAAAQAAATAAAAMPKSPPRYYAALDDPVGSAYSDPLPGKRKGQVNVVVGDTGTGRTLATVTPPHGQTFVGVTGAADDRTFVVAAAAFPLPDGTTSASPVAWYLLRIAPGTAHPDTLRPLSTIFCLSSVDGMALSPDGSELAVMCPQDTLSEALTIYSVRTGQTIRTWTASLPGGYGMDYWGRISNSSISWLAGGHTLAFVSGTFAGVNGPLGGGAGGVVMGDVTVRELDLSRAGSDLFADSTKVLKPAHAGCDTLQLTADGKTAICGAQGDSGSRGAASDPRIVAFSLATGKSHVRYLLNNGTWALGIADVLWASPDGSTLIGAMNEQSEVDGVGPDHTHRVDGVIGADGHFQPLTIPLHDGPPVAGQIAF